MPFSREYVVCICTDRCPAPRKCCTSCQRRTSGGSGWRMCSRSCLGFCAVRWAPGSGVDQHSRQSCTVCLKTWLGETHKAVVTLILLRTWNHTAVRAWWRPCGTHWSTESHVWDCRNPLLLFYNHIWNSVFGALYTMTTFICCYSISVFLYNGREYKQIW